MFEDILITTPSAVDRFLSDLKTAEQEIQDLNSELFEYRDMLADDES